jgi:hypothetical protein
MSGGEAGVGECDAYDEGDGCAGVSRRKRTRREIVGWCRRSLQEGTMTDEYAPSEEILKVAEEGIRGMLNCVASLAQADEVIEWCGGTRCRLVEFLLRDVEMVPKCFSIVLLSIVSV